MLQLVGRSFVFRLQQLFPHLKHPMLLQVRHPQLLLGEDRLQKLSATPCQARPGALVSVTLAPGICLCLLNSHPVLSAILLCDLCVSYPTLTCSALMLGLAACLTAIWLPAGEFELHANCWMGWPDSGYLWRDDAKPAQEQYAEIAKAISQFEPVVMMANPEASAGLSSSTCDHCYVVHVLCHAPETAAAFHVPSARLAVVQAYVLHSLAATLCKQHASRHILMYTAFAADPTRMAAGLMRMTMHVMQLVH